MSKDSATRPITDRREVIQRRVKTQAKRFTWVASATGGQRLTHDGEAVFSITIDLDRLIEELGNKALGNKSRQAKEVNGAVVVRCESFVENAVGSDAT